MFRGGWTAVMALLVTHTALAAETGALADASMNGDIVAMNALLKKHADPNAPGAFGTPALHWRVHVDDVVEAKRLVDRHPGSVRVSARTPTSSSRPST